MGTSRNIPKARKKPIRRISKDTKKVIIIHDNKIDSFTSKAHEIGKIIDEMDDYEAIIDKEYWNPGEKTSPTETNNREKKMVKKADIGYKLVVPSSQTNEPRHDGSKREARKIIKAGKPFVEHFYQDAKDSPNRPLPEKNYKKREVIRNKKGQHIKKIIKQALDKVSEDKNEK